MLHPLIFETVIIIWVISEIALTAGRRASQKDARDRGSLTLIWIAFIGAMFGASMVSHLPETSIRPGEVAFWGGIALIVIGIVVRSTAIITLGRYFTVNVAIQEEHQIVQRGLYRFVRHPSYLGSLFALTGVGLAMGNWLSVAIAFLVPFLAVSYRIAVEECALIEHFGDAYRQYATRTKRLIPGVY